MMKRTVANKHSYFPAVLMIAVLTAVVQAGCVPSDGDAGDWADFAGQAAVLFLDFVLSFARSAFAAFLL